MTWTHFWDMSSGGGRKLAHNHIYIEAAEEAAIRVFYTRFNRNPNRVTCTCCGEDYSISNNVSLLDLTEYHRDKSRYNEPQDLMSMEEYEESSDVLIIRASEITEEEHLAGEPPEEGFVWQG